MKNLPLKTLALALSAIAVNMPVAAEPTAKQMNSIKLYGDVTIAQDSVTEWGPWTEFEPPAAGNPPLNLPPANAVLYRTLPLLADAELLGFGTFYTVVNNGTPVSDDQAFAVVVTGTSGSPTSPGKLLPDSLTLQTNAITGVYPPPNTVDLALQGDGTYRRVSNLEFDQLTLLASPDEPSDATPAPVTFYQLISYISDGNTEGNPIVQGVATTGVIGRTTPITDIAALRLGNVTATYDGHSLVNQARVNQAGVAPMTMTVNFGQSAWTGTWNSGRDTNGAVGFSASGRIAGAQFSSAPGSITALDSNNISGSVKGAFYGAQAAAVGGIADITKNNVHYVDPFIAYKQPAVAPTPTPNVPSGIRSQ